MKKMFSLCALAAVCLAVACGPTHVVIQTSEPAPAPAPAPPPEITYQTFYDALSPYGEWTDYPGMGYVWIPNAGPDFQPYGSAGQWVYADEGWTWMSDYSWGWAPFHYGRWFFDDSYGWCWIPGYEWAPAWVSWRSSSDYYGWAPLGPAAYNPPPQRWCFVPRQYVNSPHVNNYYVNRSTNVTIINNTTIINNYRGPSRSEVETVTRAPIRPVNIRQGSAPGAGRLDNGQLTIYRPPVRAANPGGAVASPAPARVSPFRGRGNPNGGQNQAPPQNPRPVTPPQQQPAPPQNPAPQTQPQNPPRRTFPQQNPPQTQPPNPRPVPPQNPRPAPQQRPSQPQGQPQNPRPAPPQNPQPRTLPPHTAPNQPGNGGRVMPGGAGARQQRIDTARRRGN